MKLKFATYNIQHGALDLPTLSHLAGNITALGLDVVALQEVDQNTRRVNGIDTMQTLSNATKYPYYRFFKSIDYRGGEYGIGVLSKHPILSATRIPLTTPVGLEARVLGKAEICANGVTFPFFVTHLSHEATEPRLMQFGEVANVLRQCKGFVLTGDFNTSNFEEYTVIQNAGMVNRKDMHCVTFPGNHSSIDNIVYDRDTWHFSAPKTLLHSYSDHYLLYAEATYQPQE